MPPVWRFSALALIALTFLAFLPLSARACDQPCVIIPVGNVRIEIVFGNIIDQKADVWVATHLPGTVNDEKGASGAIASIDEAPFAAFRTTMQQAGGRLPHGGVYPVPAGEAMARRAGVRQVFHAIEYDAINRIKFFTLDDLEASTFPFSPADRESYALLIRQNAATLAKAKAMIDRGKMQAPTRRSRSSTRQWQSFSSPTTP